MVFGSVERMVSMRYLRTRRQESFISIIAAFSLIGIALGVAALIVVMAVMNGLRHDLFDRIIGITGHITVEATGGRLADYRGLAEEIRGLPGVVRVVPTAEGHVVVSARGGGATGAVLRGVPPELLIAKGVVGDSYLGEAGTVVVGLRLAGRLGVSVGDRLTVVVPGREEGVPGVVPRVRGYPVAAVFSVGMNDYDNAFVYAPLETVQDYLRLGDAVSFLEVTARDPGRVEELRQRIAALAGEGVRVYDWQQSNASFFNAVQVERAVTFLLLTLVVVVAAFNIISSLSMLVKDKGRDIAILRTMGATRGMILRIFVLSGASIGVAGTLIGLALGLGFAGNVEEIRALLQSLDSGVFTNEIRFLSRLPARIEAGEVLAVAAMALGLSFAATLFPSWRAARLDPVEALRYE